MAAPAETSTAPAGTSSATASAPADTFPEPQAELIPAEQQQDDTADDADSALGDDAADSTASLTTSILAYRNIRGRTYHSDRYSTDYFLPNDGQQLDSMDITHHYLMLLLNKRMFLAPIKSDVQRVVDIGTGTGTWATDFADEYPGTQVIGTDLSPTQPLWVAPNVQFEVDDATMPWTWKDNMFDFVHMRYLFGAIKDWNSLFKEAYRCCAPGGWVESCEADVEFRSDDATTDLEPVLAMYKEMFEASGEATGRPFFVSDLQTAGVEAAGFVGVKTFDYKIPVSDWPKDPTLAEIGRYVRLTMENDIEGYTSLLWHDVLNRPKDDYQIFLMGMRKAIRNRQVHSYMKVRYVIGQKPE